MQPDSWYTASISSYYEHCTHFHITWNSQNIFGTGLDFRLMLLVITVSVNMTLECWRCRNLEIIFPPTDTVGVNTEAQLLNHKTSEQKNMSFPHEQILSSHYRTFSAQHGLLFRIWCRRVKFTTPNVNINTRDAIFKFACTPNSTDCNETDVCVRSEHPAEKKWLLLLLSCYCARNNKNRGGKKSKDKILLLKKVRNKIKDAYFYSFSRPIHLEDF